MVAAGIAALLKPFEQCDHYPDPEDAFANGLRSKGPRRDLRAHVANEQDTDFVSTSSSKEVDLREFGNHENTRMYVIESNRGIDANAVLKYDGRDEPNLYDYELEISSPGGVRPEEIQGTTP